MRVAFALGPAPAHLYPLDAVQAVRDQVTRVLKEPAFTEGAARLRRDMLASPSPADLVPTLENLAHAR